MEYALTILVFAVFFVAYLLVKKKPKEEALPTLNEEEYLKEVKATVFRMQAPDKNCQINDKQYKRRVKWLRFVLKSKKYKGIFEDFFGDKAIVDQICKIDFSPLCDNPSIENEPRNVKIAKLCLSSAGWIFTEDRFKIIACEQNRVRTLTYFEIESMKEAFLYAILEKLYYILENLNTVAKVLKIAKKYVKDDGNLALDKRYKSFAKSKLFLELCMIESNYKKSNVSSLEGAVDGLYTIYARLVDDVGYVLNFDFSRYYSPLEIYDKFDSFQNASENEKKAFLSLASKLSDKENLDEFMYAIRVEKYMQSASAGHSKMKRINWFGGVACVISHKNDISMLGAGLNSDFFMSVYFGGKKGKENKSISKIVDFENSFEPIYKFDNLNFGISTKGNVLRVSPHLPENIESADVVFSKNGVNHTMHLKRGDDTRIYLGSTRIEGTRYIKLANKPLDVTVVVKR